MSRNQRRNWSNRVRARAGTIADLCCLRSPPLPSPPTITCIATSALLKMGCSCTTSKLQLSTTVPQHFYFPASIVASTSFFASSASGSCRSKSSQSSGAVIPSPPQLWDERQGVCVMVQSKVQAGLRAHLQRNKR